eukprot:GEMP01026382.1.p1 GENE.GEMP01026382.1~~GEMP01026382.1.p1  ORF type:complete len:556 (+),score=127.69 GEMP01026382.1:91-1758(+)
MDSVKHEDVALFLESSATGDEVCIRRETTATECGFPNDYTNAVLTSPPAARLPRYSAPLTSYASVLLQLHIITAHVVAFPLVHIDELWYLWMSLIASASFFAAIEARSCWTTGKRRKWHQRWFWTWCDGWLRCVKLTAYILFVILQTDPKLQISAILFIFSTVVISALLCWTIAHKLKMIPNLFLDFCVHNPLSFHVAYFSVFAIGGSTFSHVETRQSRWQYPLSIGLDSAALAGMTIIPRGLAIILLDIPLLVLAFVAPMKPLFHDEESMAAWTARAMLPLALLSWIKFRCDLRLFIEGANYKERRTLAKKRRAYSGRWIKTHKALRELKHELVQREEEERERLHPGGDSRNQIHVPPESAPRHDVGRDLLTHSERQARPGRDASAFAPHPAPYTLPGQNGGSPLLVERLPESRSRRNSTEGARRRDLCKCVDNDSRQPVEAEWNTNQWRDDVEQEECVELSVDTVWDVDDSHGAVHDDFMRPRALSVGMAWHVDAYDGVGKIDSRRRAHVEDTGNNNAPCEGVGKIDSTPAGTDVDTDNLIAVRERVDKYSYI